MVQVVLETQHLQQRLSLWVPQVLPGHVAPAAPSCGVVCRRSHGKVVRDGTPATLLQDLGDKGHIFGLGTCMRCMKDIDDITAV